MQAVITLQRSAMQDLGVPEEVLSFLPRGGKGRCKLLALDAVQSMFWVVRGKSGVPFDRAPLFGGEGGVLSWVVSSTPLERGSWE